MRTVMAIVIGVMVGNLILLSVGAMANALQPTPPALMDPTTPEAVAMRVAAAPLSTWLSTLFGLALGAIVGGLLGAAIAREHIKGVTRTIGLVLSLWAFYTFYIVYPTVLWVPLAMFISVFLFTYLGGQVISRQQARH